MLRRLAVPVSPAVSVSQLQTTHPSRASRPATLAPAKMMSAAFETGA